MATQRVLTSLRISPALYEQLRRMADADGRSVNSYVARALQWHVTEREEGRIQRHFHTAEGVRE